MTVTNTPLPVVGNDGPCPHLSQTAPCPASSTSPPQSFLEVKWGTDKYKYYRFRFTGYELGQDVSLAA